METLRINIVNPKAKKLLEDLEAMNLIAIQDGDPRKSFQKLLDKLRSKKQAISLEEITQEVEVVRTKRYARKNK